MSMIMAIIPRSLAAALLIAALGSPAPAHAQANSSPAQTPAPTTSTVRAPTPTALTQTCLFGCSNQFTACQNTCLASAATGTTVSPSPTILGVRTNQNTCHTNCSSQQLTCQRNCNLGP